MKWVKQCMQQLKPQSGSTMVECCLAILPIILLGSLILEVTYWHTARHRLALALSQAVDLATMRHGEVLVAWQYLKEKRPELNIQAQDVRVVQADTDITAIFSEFADAALSKEFRQPTIRHDFLIAQHEKFKLLGWSGGRGPITGKNILEANTLSVTVVGWHRPYLSWLSAVLKLWQGHGRMAIRVTQSAMMQSHRFKPKGHHHLTMSRFEINRSSNLLTKSKSNLTLSTQMSHLAKSTQSTQDNQANQANQAFQTNQTDLNPNHKQSIQPYIPKAWKGAEQVNQACGAGECCSDEPAHAE
jgi:hypothetical protein